jgi:hypothetical protein
LKKFCAFGECSREAYHGDLCNAHRQQRKRGQQLRPLKDARGGRFGGNPTGRLKRAAMAYADAELDDIDEAWKNLADAARWFALGVPKSGTRSIVESMADVRAFVRRLESAVGQPPRTPGSRLYGGVEVPSEQAKNKPSTRR